jgi:hypothetical protein
VWFQSTSALLATVALKGCSGRFQFWYRLLVLSGWFPFGGKHQTFGDPWGDSSGLSKAILWLEPWPLCVPSAH